MDPQPAPRNDPAFGGEPIPTAGREVEAPPPPPHQVARTRAGSVYAAAIAFAVLLLLLLIFILQNGCSVRVSFLGLDGHLPLAVALLLAAVIGALLVGLLGLARVIQLRHIAKRHQKQDLRR